MATSLAVAAGLMTGAASAQTRSPEQVTPQGQAQDRVEVTATATPPTTPPPPPGSAETAGRLEDLVPHPGGLTADAAALRALRTSYNVRAAEANVQAAEAQQTEAGRSMIPQLALSARYTRLSEITPPSIGAPVPTPILLGNQAVACVQQDGTVTAGMSRDCNGGRVGQPLQNPPSSFSFPVILDQFVIRGSLTVPLSDIPLRLLQVYRAAGFTVEARRLDEAASRLQVGMDTRVAFYDYLRMLGQLAVAQQGLETARHHLRDVARFVEVGTLARAEQLRVEAQVAESERIVVMARNGVELTASVLRQRMHLGPGERIVLGESIEEPVSVPSNLQDMISRAHHDRPEIQSLERQRRALDANLTATRMGLLPSLAGVVNVDVANPNSRFFPQTQEFNTTWDATLQLQWSPTSALVTSATVSRLNAQSASLVAGMEQLREGLELEVRSAWLNAQGAGATIEAARRQVQAAEESYRVRRERFQAGAAVSSDLTDAEMDLTRARLALVNAHMDLRTSLARLRRAVGQPERE